MKKRKSKITDDDLVKLAFFAEDPRTSKAERALTLDILGELLPDVDREPATDEQVASFMKRLDAEIEKMRRS